MWHLFDHTKETSNFVWDLGCLQGKNDKVLFYKQNSLYLYGKFTVGGGLWARKVVLLKPPSPRHHHLSPIL
jgi:hypothetical protein